MQQHPTAAARAVPSPMHADQVPRQPSNIPADFEELIFNTLGSVSLLLEVCYNLNPFEEDVSTNDLVKEFLPQCRTVHARVRKALESEQVLSSAGSLLETVCILPLMTTMIDDGRNNHRVAMRSLM
jgi:hypothetical protein